MNKLNTLDIIALILLIIGGLNWGLVGLAGYNIVDSILGGTSIDMIIYVLVGLAAVYILIMIGKLKRA